MRFVVPEQKKFTHQMLIPVRWGDMDAMGHVNNALYFRYLETARMEFLYSLGARAERHAGTGPVIVNAFCNFIRQVEYPAELLAKHYVANPGQSSFDTFITLERSDEPGTIYAEGGATTVWVDYQAMKSVPLPDPVRALLA